MVGEHPSCDDGSAAGDDSGYTLNGFGYVGEPYACMDCHVVHALFRLFNEYVAEDFPGEFFGFAAYPFQGFVDGYGSDGYGAVSEYPFTGFPDVVASGEVHDGVGTPVACPDGFFYFFADGGGYGGCTDVGVDFDAEVASDDHGFGFGVVDVGRDNCSAASDFLPDEFGCDFFGEGSAEGHTRVAACPFFSEESFEFFQFLVFADCDVFHFGCDDALSGVVHLGDDFSGSCASWFSDFGEAQLSVGRGFL